MEILSIIVASLVLLGLFLMVFFVFLANKYQQYRMQRRLKAVDKASQYRGRKPKHIKLTDDLRSKDRGLEKLKQEQRDTNIEVYEEYNRSASSPSDDIEIVGVAKPVGRWSNFVMKQKMGFILAMGGLQSLRGQHNDKEGFWTNLIKAQGASRGKGASKGR